MTNRDWRFNDANEVLKAFGARPLRAWAHGQLPL